MFDHMVHHSCPPMTTEGLVRPFQEWIASHRPRREIRWSSARETTGSVGIMRKMLMGLGLVFTLTLAPTAAAMADAPVVPAAHSQPSPSPQSNDNDSGNGGKWGLLGLLGLLGLAGLRKQKQHVGTTEHIPNRPRP
ncbi:WGxxGxxG family protein [Nonomuraea sp. NPDC005501]|uniref:WGxxGxxG family protein n=1 Tax=Nonomuraea sp. NPDC005501 TaxID=3156884 RepID=UPI0033A4BF1F